MTVYSCGRLETRLVIAAGLFRSCSGNSVEDLVTRLNS